MTRKEYIATTAARMLSGGAHTNAMYADCVHWAIRLADELEAQHVAPWQEEA